MFTAEDLSIFLSLAVLLQFLAHFTATHPADKLLSFFAEQPNQYP
jgi:hypothetical protein